MSYINFWWTTFILAFKLLYSPLSAANLLLLYYHKVTTSAKKGVVNCSVAEPEYTFTLKVTVIEKFSHEKEKIFFLYTLNIHNKQIVSIQTRRTVYSLLKTGFNIGLFSFGTALVCNKISKVSNLLQTQVSKLWYFIKH